MSGPMSEPMSGPIQRQVAGTAFVLVASVLALLGVLSCARGGPQPTTPPSSASSAPELLDLRVLSLCLEPAVGISVEGDVGASMDVRLRDALATALDSTGLGAKRIGPCDVLLRLDAKLRGAAYLVGGHVTLLLESRSGLTLGRIDSAPGLSREGEFPALAARQLLAGVLTSPKLRELAAQKIEHADEQERAARDQAIGVARPHADQASRLYAAQRFIDALREYEEAYVAYPDPVFLFNIGQCHRRLGQREAARAFYQAYLDRVPGAANRAEVERHIDSLK